MEGEHYKWLDFTHKMNLNFENIFEIIFSWIY